MSRVHPSGDDKEGQAAGRRNTLSGSWTTVEPTLIGVEDLDAGSIFFYKLILFA